MESVCAFVPLVEVITATISGIAHGACLKCLKWPKGTVKAIPVTGSGFVCFL
jgi:hypothetical protein